jgi:hypothetical protein
MSQPDPAEDLALVRRRNPTWVIVGNENGTYTARRDWWGSQQILTVPTLAELDASLQALDRRPAGIQPCAGHAPSAADGTRSQ